MHSAYSTIGTLPYWYAQPTGSNPKRPDFQSFSSGLRGAARRSLRRGAVKTRAISALQPWRTVPQPTQNNTTVIPAANREEKASDSGRSAGIPALISNIPVLQRIPLTQPVRRFVTGWASNSLLSRVKTTLISRVILDKKPATRGGQRRSWY